MVGNACDAGAAAFEGVDAFDGGKGVMNWNCWLAPTPTRYRPGEDGIGEAMGAGGFHSSVWMDISLSTGLGCGGCTGAGSAMNSADTDLESYVAEGTTGDSVPERAAISDAVVYMEDSGLEEAAD